MTPATHLPPATTEGDFKRSILPGGLHGISYVAGGQRLLNGIEMTFDEGPRTVLLGPNGAGKSLCLRIAHGLLRPSEGEVRWGNRKTEGAGKAPRRQAMVFQRPVLLRRSVAANLDYALALHGATGAEKALRRNEALERTGLLEKAHQPARTLSGGEQQRLALARAWALKPQVLFLDEPSASLDPAATKALEEIIQAIHEGGTKIIMTTHDLGQAKRLADEVIFIHRGRVLEQGPAEAFFNGPTSKEGQAFLMGELTW